MSQPPIREFNATPTPPQPVQAQRATANPQRSASFFSFARRRPSLSAQSTDNPTRQPPPPPKQQQQEGAPMNGQGNLQQYRAQNSPQPNYQAQNTPFEQQPQQQPARPQPMPIGVPPGRASQDDLNEAPGARRLSGPAAQPPPLHPELRSFVSLSFAHVHKIYFSGPLVRKVERTADGGRPSAKDDQWVDVWGQLGGTTLSIWEMREIELANAEGREVPPSYINVTDAFVSVLGSITVPPQGNNPPKRFTNVLTLNTAGSNLVLFACPDAPSLVSWAAALRLASWEKSRLEEIYTAHLLRMTLSDGGAWKEPRTTLVKGQMEGWAQIRVAGQTGWKRVWIVLTAAGSHGQGGSTDGHPPPPNGSVTRRISRLIGGGGSDIKPAAVKSNLAVYTSPKGRGKRPWLTVYDITQVFAVYPERPEMISKSTLIKVEGLLSDEEGSGNMRGREAWVFIMPELETIGSRMGVMEMLKWVVGLHDSFELYGRPKGYTWDPRDPISMMFAYPFGPLKDHLFLDRELAENLDPREERTAVIRNRLLSVLVERMQGPPGGDPNAGNINGNSNLPPIQINGTQRPGQSLLTPITERSVIATRENTLDGHFETAAPGGDLQRHISSAASHSSLQGSPSIIAVANGAPERPSPNPGSSGGSVGSTAFNAVVPVEPPPPVRASQTFEPQLPPIPASNATSPLPTPGADPPLLATAKSPNGTALSGGVPASPKANGEASGKLSPQSFARSLWSDGSALAASSPQQANPSLSDRPPVASPEPFTPSPTMPGNHSNAPLPQPNKNMSPSSLERPRSLNSVPRSLSSHRQNSYTAAQPSQGQPQRVTSPLATPYVNPPPPPLAPQPQSQGAGPSKLSGDELPGYDGAGGSQYPQEKKTALNEEGELSPVSASSYPASAQMQNPDLLEPQPKPSRSSHTVLSSAPFMDSDVSSSAIPSQPQYMQQSTASSSGPRPQQNDTSQGYPAQQQYGQQPQHFQPRDMAPLITPPRGPSPAASSSVQTSPGQIMEAKTAGRGPTPLSFLPTGATPQQQTNVPYQSPVAGVRASQVHVQRRPSGARAPPAKKVISAASSDLRSVKEDYDQTSASSYSQPERSTSSRGAVRNEMDDYGADAIAALSLADQIDHPGKPELLPPAHVGSQQAMNRSASPAYPSSFAASRAATDRKAKAQAQQAAAQAAATRPGRSGKAKGRKAKGAWGSEEDDEEDDEEEDDDDDGDSDGPTPAGARRPESHLPYNLPPSVAQHLYDQRRGTPPDPRRGTPPNGRPLPSTDHQSQQRGGRNLPMVPGGRSPSGSITRGQEDSMYRPRTQHDEMGAPQPRDGQRGRDVPPQLRSNVWINALNDPHNPNPTNSGPGRDTFVKVEDEAETISKVFAPQGLLQAGLQDKHDRSAKRQEELARESGTSLINVPGKPLDPQTGLLGAVTAHERDRKRDGGVGAALTKKLAEERVAEDRQRKIDELQRQQLDSMTNGGGGSVYGDMYGGQYPNPMMTPGGQFGGYNPMMMNPMMMGMGWGGMGGMGSMTPGMGGITPGMGGMPGMGMSPQQMLASQAAAEAYQRAMMTFSQAGSIPGSKAASEFGDPSPSPGGGSRMGAVSPFPQMGMLSPMVTGMSANPMFMNPMMMGGMGGMGGGMGMMGGGMGAGMIPNASGMYPQQYSPGIPTPSTDQHNGGSRFSSFNNASPDNVDRSAGNSQQGHRDSPDTRPSPN